MKKIRIYTIVFFLLALILLGCRESLIIKDFEIESPFYWRSGYFLGNREVLLRVDLANNYNGELTYGWSSDGGRFISKDENEALYLTSQEPGDYRIKLLVTDRSGREVSYDFSFSVRGDYPDKVNLKEVKTKSLEDGVLLEWSQHKGDDFYGYKIFRSQNRYIDEKTKVIGEIDQREVTSFTDYNLKGDRLYTYQIMVINDQGYLSLSNEETVYTLPNGVKSIPLGESVIDWDIDFTNRKGYFINDKGELMIFSMLEEEVLNKVPLDYNPELLLLGEGYLVLAKRGDRFIRVLDIESLTLFDYEFDSDIKDIELKKEDLYLLLDKDNEESLVSFNITEWEIQKRWQLKRGGSSLKVERIKVLAEEYLMVEPYFREPLIYKFDDFENPSHKLDMQFISLIKSWNFNGEDYLFLLNQSLFEIGLFKLNSEAIEKKGLFKGSTYPSDFIFIEDKGVLLVSYEDKRVKMFSIEDYSLKREWSFNSYIDRMIYDHNGEKLYLLTSGNDFLNFNLLFLDLDDISIHY